MIGRCGAGVTAHRAVVQGSDEIGAQGYVCPDPGTTLAANEATVEHVAVIFQVVDGELLEPILRVRVRLVGVGHLL